MEKDVIKANGLDQIFNGIVGIWTGYLLQGVGFYLNEQDAKNRVRRVLDALYFEHREYELTASELLGIVFLVFIKTEIVYEVNGTRIESADIPLLKLRRFIGEWIVEKKREYQENLQLFNPTPSKSKIKTNKQNLFAAQYVLIEYFTEGKLRQVPEFPPFDKSIRHRELAQKYGIGKDAFNKAFQRIDRILNSRPISSNQVEAYRADLIIVQKYFNSNGNTDLAQKVQSELDSFKLN
jgi:hypothetical protein